MELLVSKRLEQYRAHIKRLAERRVLNSPERVLDEKRMILLSDERRLESAAKLLNSRKSARTFRAAYSKNRNGSRK